MDIPALVAAHPVAAAVTLAPLVWLAAAARAALPLLGLAAARLLFEDVVLDGRNGCDDAVLAVLRRGPRWRYGLATYSAKNTWVRHEDRARVVFYRRPDVSMGFYFWRGRPLFFRPPRSATTASGYAVESPHLYCLRGTVAWPALLAEAAGFVDAAVDAQGDPLAVPAVRRYRVRYYAGSGGDSGVATAPKAVNGDGGMTGYISVTDEPVNYRHDELGEPPAAAPEAVIALSPGMQGVLQDAAFWRRSVAWYQDRGLPWRRGYLLYGPPGTGKTSLARAVAEKLDLPVAVFALATMRSHEFTASWSEARAAAGGPLVVLFEDVDTVFNGRTNITQNDLTLDTVLNALDGVETATGVLLFVTTNRVEAVDPALGAPTGSAGESSRPGRIDRAVEIGPPDRAGRYKIALRVTLDPALAAGVADGSEGCSGAVVQDRAQKAALQQLWGDYDETNQ